MAMQMIGFVTEFEFYSPESVKLWQHYLDQQLSLELENVGPGEPCGDMRHAVTCRAANPDCWYTLRIETYGVHGGVEALHKMRVEGYRAAFADRSPSPSREIYRGLYEPGS